MLLAFTLRHERAAEDTRWSGIAGTKRMTIEPVVHPVGCASDWRTDWRTSSKVLQIPEQS